MADTTDNGAVDNDATVTVAAVVAEAGPRGEQGLPGKPGPIQLWANLAGNLFALQRKTWANIAGIQRSDNN